MSLKLFDHFGSSWASGRRTSCCGDLAAPQVRALLPPCGGDGEGAVTAVSPPCPLRAARDGGRGAAGGCRTDLVWKKRGLAENWRARLSPAAEGVHLERGAKYTEGRWN